MPVTHEPALADRLLADDEQVLAEVLRAFGPAIRGLLCRKYHGLLADDEVDDVLSIGLFRLWRSRQRFDQDKGTLRVWFCRIVDNVARDVLQLGWQRARRMEVAADPRALAAFPDPRSNGHATPPAAALSPIQIQVRRIIDDLPDIQRQIILTDTLSREEISSQSLGRELGIPASTVRVYRKRALERIRSQLLECGYQVPQ